MKDKNSNSNTADKKAATEEKAILPGYSIYPSNEDIYNRALEVTDVSQEKDSKFKQDFTGDINENGLDVPGAELDDAMENIGSEDEENNYYSLGGDEHNNLEEDKGE